MAQDAAQAGAGEPFAAGGGLHDGGVEFLVVEGDFGDGVVHLGVDAAAVDFAVGAAEDAVAVLLPGGGDDARGVGAGHVGDDGVGDAAGEVGLAGEVGAGGEAGVVEAHAAALGAGGVGVEGEIQPVPPGPAVGAAHGIGHAVGGGDVVVLVLAGGVVDGGGEALGVHDHALGPVAGAFEFARVAGLAGAAAGDVAHAVAEADGVGDDGAFFVGGVVGDVDAAVGAGVEPEVAEPDPSVADLAVVDADVGDASAVVDAVELRDAVGAGTRPDVDGVFAGGGEVRAVGGPGGGAGGAGVGPAVADFAGLAVVVVGLAGVAPAAAVGDAGGEGGGGVDVVDDDFVGLVAERAHRDDGRARLPRLEGEVVELVEVAEVFDHAAGNAASGGPGVGAGVGSEAMPRGEVEDDAGKRAVGLLGGRGAEGGVGVSVGFFGGSGGAFDGEAAQVDGARRAGIAGAEDDAIFAAVEGGGESGGVGEILVFGRQ